MSTNPFGEGANNELFENFEVNAAESLNRKTGFPHLVCSQFGKQFLAIRKVAHEIDADVNAYHQTLRF